MLNVFAAIVENIIANLVSDGVKHVGKILVIPAVLFLLGCARKWGKTHVGPFIHQTWEKLKSFLLRVFRRDSSSRAPPMDTGSKTSKRGNNAQKHKRSSLRKKRKRRKRRRANRR